MLNYVAICSVHVQKDVSINSFLTLEHFSLIYGFKKILQNPQEYPMTG